MNAVKDKYDIVVGLEVHIQLTTNTKLFCNDAASYGAAANEHTGAISLGHPGTLPRINEKAIEQAIKLGLALGCSITRKNYFSRKHYLYPDLPKGYQTTQHINPVCEGGSLKVMVQKEEKNIILHHIHLEEDAGKSIHDIYPDYTAVDFNRAGTPLCELVTEPCIHSSEEAYSFLTELRKIVRWIGVSDGNMEEGSLRCDANISIKPKGSTVLGTRVEVKNLNSIRFVKKAIELEAARLMDIIDSGGKVQQETRSFDAATETTFTLRSKEDANDYRYFIEPDLSPTIVTPEQIDAIHKKMPALPNQLQQELINKYSLSLYDAVLLTEDMETYRYFLDAVTAYPNQKAIANYMNGPVRSYCNEHQMHIKNFSLSATQIAAVVKIIDAGTINFSVAGGKLFQAWVKEPELAPEVLISKMGLEQQNSADEITGWIQKILQKYPEKVTEYKKGKKGLIGFFTGEVVKLSKGKAAPKTTQELLQKALQ